MEPGQETFLHFWFILLNMSNLDKFQSVIILFAAALGLLLGQFDWFSIHGDKFIVPFLMLMLTIVFLNVPLKEMREAFKNFRFSSLSLGMNFIWTPLFAWMLGFLFLKDHPDLWVGFIMLLVTPCTDWYLVFTQMAGGNVTLAATLLPWHLILQLLLLPLYLFLFAGKLVPIDLSILLQSVFLVLVIPLILAILLDKIFSVIKGETWLKKVFLPRIAPLQLIFLCLAITAMFSSQGKAIIANPTSTLVLIPPLIIFYLSNLFLSMKTCKLAKIEKTDSIGFSFSTLARNSPIALAIAVTAFPERPAIALALVIGPLIELPVMALFVNFFKIRTNRNNLEAN